MRNSFKAELKMWFHTGRIIVTLGVLLGADVFFAALGISSIEEKIKAFTFSINMISSDAEIYRILQEPLIYEDGSVNAVLKNKMDIEMTLHALSPHNALLFCTEVGFYLFPIIMTILGAQAVCQEYSTGVMRVRVSREGKWKYFVAKQTVMILVAIGLISMATLLYRIGSKYFFDIAKKHAYLKYIDTSEGNYSDTGNILYLVLLFALCIIIFLEIGFSIGYLFKSSIIPSAIVGFLWFINIIPLDYGPKNAIYNVANRLSRFDGFVPNGMVSVITNFSASIVIVITLMLPLIVAFFTWDKRSFYK